MSGEQSEQELAATFYVYRIFDGFETLYVGKGSGRRLKQQIKRFRCGGEILQSFKIERDAYKAERHWIEKLKPTENRCSGGNGGWTRGTKTRAPKFKWEREMEAIGTRAYCARMLLRFDLRGLVERGRLEKIREVAYGQAV